MIFDVGEMAPKSRYNLLASLIVPRPIAWITTVDVRGSVNAAPFSFFNLMSGTPPLVCIGIGAREGIPKDTARNIGYTGEFVINLVDLESVESMNITAGDYPAAVDETAVAGLELVASQSIAPPRLARAPVSLECVEQQTLSIGYGRSIVVGEITTAHVDDEHVLDPSRGHIDGASLDLVGRMHGGGWYTTTSDPFRLARVDQPSVVSGSLK
nr:flavin reductase family protein [Rhodococcus erythropolis]